MAIGLRRRVPATLTELLAPDGVVRVPGTWDGMTARIAAQAGFPAVFASGLAIAASMGLVDSDIYTKADVLYALGLMVRAADIPVIADGDTGFGTAVNVMYMVRDMERTGVSGVAIEDQQSPKRCPMLPGKSMPLVSVAEAVGKIKAAVEARSSKEFVIIARSDAGTAEEMHRRADAYAAAGADMFFPNAVRREVFPPEEWARCHARIGLPLVAAPVPGGWQEAEFTPEVMASLGVKIEWLAAYPLYAATSALRSVMARMASGLPLSELLDGGFGYDDLMKIVGYEEIASIQSRFVPDAE